MSSVIEAKGLVKRYGDFEAVAGIDFEVHPGEFFGLLGPNGAGKSTTMKMIYRLTPVTEGRLVILGKEAGKQDRAIKAEIGVVPQMDNLDEELDVFDNLYIYGRFHDIDSETARSRATELLEFAELSSRARAPLKSLSGGMLRRLTLARGLMNEPRLLLLDEPTTGLDPQVRLSIWDKLSELRRKGVTLVMSTHYMDEAERLCERLLVLDHGRIIAQGTPRELVSQHVSPEVVEARLFDLELSILEKAAAELEATLLVAADRISLFAQDGRAVLGALAEKGVDLPGAYVRPGNLEDVFLHLTGRSLRE